MTGSSQALREAMATHDAYETESTDGDEVTGRVTTTPFDAVVTAGPSPDGGYEFVVTVRVPTLDAATVGEVGSAVADNWFETLERRLADAPKATRTSVSLADFTVESAGDRVEVTYEYHLTDARRGLEVAKTFVEYVEGTYVQGVVPGYEYEAPVSELLSDAQQSDGGPGGTPL